MSAPSESENVLERQPIEKPSFTLRDVKKAIPPHCFTRPLLKSFSWVVQDVLIGSVLYYIATTCLHQIPAPYSYLVWPLYWFGQGCVFTGLWVIGHDCGHHAFSDYQWIDDTVGYILHTFLLTPYFSFKYSHRNHHSNTNSIDNDQIYIPSRRGGVKLISRLLNNPPGRVFMLAFWLVLGYPFYLYTNFSGKKYERFTNHFDAYGPMFNRRERFQVLLADVGILGVNYAINLLVGAKGVGWVMFIYGIPILFSSFFFTLVTYLQHTHPAVPFYDSSEWDWLRGALCTIDRDYGFMNHALHSNPQTHVLHHLVPTIPHYHAEEATAAIRPVLGEYYKIDRTPMLKAIWRETKECIFVEPDEKSDSKGILWFRKQ